MKLDKNDLLDKSINKVIDICIKLNADNEELRKKINALKAKLGTDQKRETNKELRAENRKLKSQLEQIKKTFEPQPSKESKK